MENKSLECIVECVIRILIPHIHGADHAEQMEEFVRESFTFEMTVENRKRILSNTE
jgi:hypothetical protein